MFQMHPDMPGKHKHKKIYRGSRKVNNEYMPKKAMIEDIKDETSDVKTFSLRIKEKPSGLLKYRPGQFMILSLPGCGEAPFTFASPPTKDWAFQVSVKKAGSLTDRMHGLKP